MATSSVSSGSLPLPNGKKYHCNFIYSYAARRSLFTDDTKLSLKFVEFLVKELKSWGYTQCYYYDEHSRPGADVFDQLFNTVESSIWTFVILTEHFSKNLWVKYSEKAVLKTLIGENQDSRDKLIPIVLGSAPVPKELDVNDVLSFALDENTWHDEEHEQQLRKLRRVLDGVAESKFSIQEHGDGILRSEVGHMIVSPQPLMQGASNITQNMNERQMESLSSSVAAMHVSSTLPLLPGSLATSSQAAQDHEPSSSSSRTDKEDNGDNTVKTAKGHLPKQPPSSDGSDRDLDDVDGPSSQFTETDRSRPKDPEETVNQPGRPTQLIPGSTCHVSLSEILSKLKSRVITGHVNKVHVCRENVLDGGFRAFGHETFNMWHELHVKFSDEDGLDVGGPRREFMRLALRAIQKLPIFSGRDNAKTLSLDQKCLTERTYYRAGQMLAYFIVHRGPHPNFISPTLYSALAEGIATVQPTPDEIVDYELRSQVEAIAAASSEKDFRSAVSKAINLIDMAGCMSLTVHFTPEEQTTLVKSLTKFVVCDRIQKPLQQFENGLQTMGLVDEIKKNKKQWEEVFIFQTEPLNALKMENLFAVIWSDEGSNRKRLEEKIFGYWRDFLQDLEEGHKEVTLKDLLVFTTGTDEVPSLGFDWPLQLSFMHADEAQHYTAGFPHASTCSMELKIPVVNDYNTFQRNMAAAISKAVTFTNP